MTVDRFRLKRPCTHCPFRTDSALRFATRERAEEVEEYAYRFGFPCHETAVHVEDNDMGEGGGYVFGSETQHCAGYAIMQIKETGKPWPGIDNDEDVIERLEEQMDFDAPVFASVGDFLKANT